MNLMDQYATMDKLKGQTIIEFKLWGNSIEIITTEQSLVIECNPSMSFRPWIREEAPDDE